MIGVKVGRVIVAGRPVAGTASFLGWMIAVAWGLVVIAVLVVVAVPWLLYKALAAYAAAEHRRRVTAAFQRPPKGPPVPFP